MDSTADKPSGSAASAANAARPVLRLNRKKAADTEAATSQEKEAPQAAAQGTENTAVRPDAGAEPAPAESAAQPPAKKKKKKKKRETPRWLLQAFHDHYPRLFTDPSLPSGEQEWKPLAIGTFETLEKAAAEWIASGALEVPQPWQEKPLRRVLGTALRCYTSHPRYLRALSAPDSRRWDTDGRDYEVTQEHREIARRKWRERRRAALESQKERQKEPPAGADAARTDGAPAGGAE